MPSSALLQSVGFKTVLHKVSLAVVLVGSFLETFITSVHNRNKHF